MRRAKLLISWIGLLGVAVLLLSCGDDSTRPEPMGSWEEAILDDAPAGGAILDIAFTSTRGLAVGSVASGAAPDRTYTPLVFSRQVDGMWAPEPGLPLPHAGMLTAAGMTPSGLAVVAGLETPSGSGFILDERGGWSRHEVSFGGIAFASSGDTLRFGGAAAGTAQVRVSRAADVWTPESLPYPSVGGEHGLEDLAARNGHWVACGFDDGAEGTPESPNSVLFRDNGSGWERIEVACGGCSNREFQSVAVHTGGGLFLGGSITEFGGGANDYTAFLMLRTADGDWVEIVLPAPTELRTINDILLARDGDVYMACGMDSTVILRWPAGGSIERDALIASARVTRLAEAPDGSIWAAGARLDDEGEVARPAIWKRGN